jgi:hypothetical protein
MFLGFLKDGGTRSRYAVSESGIGYVLLKLKHGEDRQYRVAELFARCMIVRDEMHKSEKEGAVVGLATELP